MMRIHGYPMSALRGDYFRAVTGMAIGLTPLAIGVRGVVPVSLLAAITALFFVFGLRTAIRHLRRVSVSDDGIAVSGPGGARVGWNEISGMSLAYFSTWRAQDKGWMQLRLEGRRGKMRLESTLDGFEEISRLAANAAQRNGVAFSGATVQNLGAMGIELADGAPAA